MALRNRRLAQLALFAAAAVAHTWPLASDLGGLSRMDNADTALNAWILSWVAHQLPLAPFHLFDANIFFPEPRTLAFSEHMVVQGVMSMPLFALGLSAVTVYNVVLLAGFALSGLAMALVVERWTSNVGAGIVAGLAYAFNAHVLVRFGHLQALHVEFLPVALFALHELMTRPAWRWAWLLVAAFTLQSLTSNYLLVMSAVAMIAFAASTPAAWLGSGAGRRWSLAAAAAALSTLALVPFLLPYYHAKASQGLVRPFDDVVMYSGQWRDYLATAGRLHYALWSSAFYEGRTPLFPGLAVAGLSIYALAYHDTWRNPRFRGVVAVGIVGVALSLGANLPGYQWLYDHVTILQGIRAVARFGWLWLLALAVLAGVGVSHLQTRYPAHARSIAVMAALLVSVEATRAPMSFTRFEGFPAIYRHVAALENPVLVEIPFPEPAMVHSNGPYVLAATTHFHTLMNGYSGFTPGSYHIHAAVARRLPSASAVREFAWLGATHFVVHGAGLDPTAIQPVAATGTVRRFAQEGEARLYAILPVPQ